MTPAKSSRPDSRERVMAAALKLFAERGVEGTTTRQIALDAGVNEVTVFRIFGTKESLLHAVIMEMVPLKDIRGVIDFEMDGTIDELMFRNAKMVLAILKRNRHVFMMMLGEMWRHPDLGEKTTQEVISNAVEMLAGIFTGLMDRKLLKRCDPELAARSWMGMVQSYFIFNYLLRSEPPSVKEEDTVLHAFAKIFLDGMRGETA